MSIPIIFSVGNPRIHKYEWADWPEDSEYTFANANRWVCMFENTTLGGDEVGQGMGLSAATSTVGEYNNVPGATGYPPSRVCTAGSSHYFDVQSGCIDTALDTSGNPWTIIMKVGSIGLVDASGPFSFAGTNAEVSFTYYASGTCARIVVDPGDGAHNLDCTNAWSDGSSYYFAVWYTGSDLCAGFQLTSAGKILTYAGLPATQKVTLTHAYDIGSFASASSFLCRKGAAYTTGTLYYLIIAKEQLIF